MASIGSRGIFHIGLIFCRYIYVRYATGLLEDGISLLHWATLIFISFFCVHIMLIHPMRCSFLSFCLFIWFKLISKLPLQICQKWETLPGFSQRNILCQNQHLFDHPRQSGPQRALHQALPSNGWRYLNVPWSGLGEVSQICNKSFKVEKKSCNFFL